LGGIKDFLRINAAGNKSRALLLTIFDLTMRRGDERFTFRQEKLRRDRLRFCARRVCPTMPA
jgi:hypothetical protein